MTNQFMKNHNTLGSDGIPGKGEVEVLPDHQQELP
eukprot:CAMPEP_0175727948 /NCGR_PEP_ID=MMETSP0097-20121207/49043_1 /TAXON_ID=311494 /ORGANISM="Alexandrium monilatum, Strain CCMP3105" /LENGTH=34 /DNA_ID= /DNA_START= /DNA_END= /DNA_ORIENTATION=